MSAGPGPGTSCSASDLLKLPENTLPAARVTLPLGSGLSFLMLGECDENGSETQL